MSDAFLRDERLFDLLTKQATEGVTSTEKSELDRLLAQYPDAHSQLIDRVVASVMLAGHLPDEPLPASLRARIESQAAREWIEVTLLVAAGNSRTACDSTRARKDAGKGSSGRSPASITAAAMRSMSCGSASGYCASSRSSSDCSADVTPSVARFASRSNKRSSRRNASLMTAILLPVRLRAFPSVREPR